MTVTTTLATQFEDALLTALQGRAGLSGVNIEMTPVDRAAGDWIMIGAGDDSAVSSSESWSLVGNVRRREVVTLDCIIEVTKSGAGETVAKAARDRAHALFAEVATELRDAAQPGSEHALLLGGKCHMFQLSSWTEKRGVGDRQRWSQIVFTITYTGDLPFS